MARTKAPKGGKRPIEQYGHARGFGVWAGDVVLQPKEVTGILRKYLASVPV